MIIREWRGRASASRAEAYPQHFRDEVMPKLQRLQGFIGAHLAQRPVDDTVEFLVLTRWKSMDAIRAFAAPDPDKAVVEPAAAAALVDYDSSVQHYDVIEDVKLP